MVVKSLFTAAFLLSCTLAWGECPDGKCESGECKKTECQSGECSEGERTKCTADEGCSEKKCAKGECPFAKCSKGKCAKSECGQDDCAVGECSKSKCAKSQCSVSDCSKGKCSKTAGAENKCSLDGCEKSDCPKGDCSVAKCARDDSAEDCCVGDSCPIAACASEAYASLKCAMGVGAMACSDGDCEESNCCVAEKCDEACRGGVCRDASLEVAKECLAAKCVAEKCGKQPCGKKCAANERQTARCSDHRAEAVIEQIEAKEQQIESLHQQVAELRRTLETNPEETAERMNVSVMLVEINRTKCRNLGIEIDFTNASPRSEEVQELIAVLEQNGLAQVIATKTQEMQNDESATLNLDASYHTTKAGDVIETNQYPSVYIQPTSTGGNGVCVVVRPTSFQRGGAFGADSQTSLAIPFRNSQFITSFGKPIVSVSKTEGVRVHRVEVAQDGTREVLSETREIQHVAFISVEPVSCKASQKSISQAAYEESLVSLVQAPECMTKVYPVPDLQVWKVRPGGVEFDADLLVNHIQSAVAPNSWRSEANPGADAAIEAFERNGSLVICQTKENHQAIAEMLNDLRRGHGEAEAKCDIPCSTLKAEGKCAMSQAIKCSAVDVSTTDVKLACGKRFVELPNAEVEEEPYPIGECSTGFSVEPHCNDGQCTR